MGNQSCKLPTCDEDRQAGSRFCSEFHELKYEHIKADARDAMMADQREAEDPHGAQPSGPPY